MTRNCNMEENYTFYPYIFNDELYIIDEAPDTAPSARPEPVETDQKPGDHPTIVEEPKAISYFGQNAKGLLILVNDPANTHLSQPELDFLMKIVEAGIGYSKHDIALVNLAHWPISQTLADIGHSHLLGFGIDHSLLPGVDKYYEVIENHGTKYLLADQLSEVEKDIARKKLFWVALKSMFQIS
ncbi:MAG: hypothetical protein HC819_10575 [Cyclobacteriaceae bacterium]|nr:hypothetical protein [Cyclobacteriaceae bacterium]